MNKTGVKIWMASIIVFIIAVIPFIFFMFNLSADNLLTAVIFVAAGAVLYAVGSKMMTHKNGYNYFHAKKFYEQCREAGFETVKQLRQNADETRRLAAGNDFSKTLDLKALCEMFEYGKDFCTKKKG